MTTYANSLQSKFKLQRSTRGAIAAASVALVLAACGGGDDQPDPYEAKGEPIAAAAGSSSASFVSYVAGLAASENDEPLVLEGFTAPTDDTTEL
jgi:hypothetical protein